MVVSNRTSRTSVAGDTAAVLLRTALDTVPYGVALIDPAGTVVLVNRVWAALAAGVESPLTRAEAGVNYLDVCDAIAGPATEDAREAAAAIRDVLAGSGAEYLSDYRSPTPDGIRYFSIRVTGAVIDGRSHAVVIHQDVTDRRTYERTRRMVAQRELEAHVDARTRELLTANERLQQTEKHLVESEARFRAAASSSADLVVEADLLLDRLHWFGDVDTLMGYEFGGFPRTRVGLIEHVHPDDRDRVQTEARRAFAAGETYHSEFRVRCKDGSYRYWESRGKATARKNGVASRAVGTQRDITDRRAVEHARRAAEQELESVIGALSDFVWSAEVRDGQISYRYYSPPVEEVTGYPPGYFMVGPARWMGIVYPEDRPQLLQAIERLLCDLGSACDEYRIVRADGAIRWVRDNVRAERVSDGVFRVHGVVSDVTGSKETDAALIDRESTLQRKQAELLELTARLFTAQEDERRRLARELHDSFNQQMAALSIQLGSLRQRHPELATEIRGELAGIQDQVVQLSNDLRRVSHELHPAALEQLGLRAALKAHCARLERQDHVGVTLTAQGLPDRLSREVSTALFRVAQEALRNVARHSAATRAEVTLVVKDGGIELTVGDDGRGFDLDGARRKGRVGLVSMEERIRPLGGRFAAASRPGQGTTITAFVPVEPVADV